MTRSTELLVQIYQELYKQKGLLPNAPAMTITPEEIASGNFDAQKAHLETAAVASILLGQKDVLQADWDNLFDLVKKYYSNQPEWKKILLDYLDYLLEVDIEKNQALEESLLAQMNELLENEETPQTEVTSN